MRSTARNVWDGGTLAGSEALVGGSGPALSSPAENYGSGFDGSSSCSPDDSPAVVSSGMAWDTGITPAMLGSSSAGRDGHAHSLLA